MNNINEYIKDPAAPISFDEAIERLKREEPVWFLHPLLGVWGRTDSTYTLDWVALKVLSDAGVKLYASKPEEAQAERTRCHFLFVLPPCC